MQTTSAGQRESPSTPTNRMRIPVSPIVAASPRCRTNSSLSRTVGALGPLQADNVTSETIARRHMPLILTASEQHTGAHRVPQDGTTLARFLEAGFREVLPRQHLTWRGPIG